MSANVNDDLVEATIRRVTQAKAAAARAGDDEAARRAAEPEASNSQPAVDYLQPAESADESAIEATIRRVAEAKAKAEAEDDGPPLDDDPGLGGSSQRVDETAIEATIRRVAEAKAQAEASSTLPDDLIERDVHSSTVESAIGFAEAAVDHKDTGSDASSSELLDSAPKTQVDETAIEATIRRVAEEKAKAEAGHAETPANDDLRTGASSVNVDESAIEATIRRVAEAKARAEANALEPDDGADQPLAAPASIDESAIEATIRRVAEAKARADTVKPDEVVDQPLAATAEIDESAIEATIRRVAGAKAPSGSIVDAVDDPIGTTTPPIDETAIEATIRRVAEANAQTDATDLSDDEAEEAFGATQDIDESAIEATIRRVAEARARDTLAQSRPESPSLRTFMRASPDTSPDEPWRQTTDRLHRDIASINATLITLAERVEALTQQLAGAANAGVPFSDQPAPAAEDDDEWDESPKILSLPTSLPPRPAIFRDPSPAAATAEPLVEEPAQQFAPAPPPQPATAPAAQPATAPAAQPATAPAAQPAPEPKRGFDLLPRTYRITIEDKRRSVDLVPLHRSLLAMDGVRDMSLLSYNNGVAIVALETVSDIDPQVLESIVGRAMSRGARVEQHNEYTLVVKLAEE
jgi:hypothetical protein